MQLLSIVDEINLSFDYNPTIDVKGVFLDISKALTGYGTREFYLNKRHMALMAKCWPCLLIARMSAIR